MDGQLMLPLAALGDQLKLLDDLQASHEGWRRALSRLDVEALAGLTILYSSLQFLPLVHVWFGQQSLSSFALRLIMIASCMPWQFSSTFNLTAVVDQYHFFPRPRRAITGGRTFLLRSCPGIALYAINLRLSHGVRSCYVSGNQ